MNGNECYLYLAHGLLIFELHEPSTLDAVEPLWKSTVKLLKEQIYVDNISARKTRIQETTTTFQEAKLKVMKWVTNDKTVCQLLHKNKGFINPTFKFSCKIGKKDNQKP